MEENKEPELMCELKDILEMIHRFNAVCKTGCFIFNFVGFKDADTTCECGEDHMEFDDSKAIFGAMGDIQTLRELCQMNRDLIEDGKDNEGFVNL